MAPNERRGWFIVASLFILMLLVFGGGYNTTPVFVPALLRGFSTWSHQRVSLLPSLLATSVGISVLPVGWLIDRVETRVLIVVGSLMAGCGLLIASEANTFAPFVVAYLMLGCGIAAGTALPTAYVVANWFEARRGTAMGIAIAGSTIGGMVMTLIAGYAIRHWGWRAAYVTVALPMITIAVPLVLISVRSRPPGKGKLSAAETASALDGYEVSEAVRTRSFWLIAAANFCFAFSATGTLIYMVSHLEGVGYSQAHAALAISLIFGVAALGKIVMGLLADRMMARRALALDFVIQAVGIALVFQVGRPAGIAFFVFTYGISVAAPLSLLPLLVAESMGLKRFGLIGGLEGLAQTSGAAVGPLLSGLIFDATKSYASAFELFILINLVGAVCAFACRPHIAAPLSGAPIAEPVLASG